MASTRAAFAAALLFLLLGSIFIPLAGIQSDEALFQAGTFGPFARERSMIVFHQRIPLMVMDYVGAAKGWLYRPVFALFTPSKWSVRLPMVLLGATTVWLFCGLLARTAGRTAAVIGGVLLATDPMFLLTTVWDWGPVAIQHFCLVAALCAFQRYYRASRPHWLALAAFLLGLGVWDKALFTWLLAGLATAALVVFPRALFAQGKPRNLALAAACFLLGALPLVLFNVRNRAATFRDNAAWSSERLGHKLTALRLVAQGAGLHGQVARDDSAESPRRPESRVERASVWMNDTLGRPRQSISGWILLAGAALLPLVWNNSSGRIARFALVFCCVAWCAMAFSRGAGGSTHHAILLWPMPYMVLAPVAATLAAKWGRPSRWAVAAIVIAAAAMHLAVLNTYHAAAIRNGLAPAWSDAFDSLPAVLDEQRIRRMYVLDWGLFDNLRLTQHTKLDLFVASQPNTTWALADLSDPNAAYVTHTRSAAFFPERAERYVRFADENGYEKTNTRLLYDRNGRPVIELFQFRKR